MKSVFCTLVCTPKRPNTLVDTPACAHEMPTFTQLPSGDWRAQVRRKPSYVSETFRCHEDTKRWALATARAIDLGESPQLRAKLDPTMFEHLIDLHIDDICEVGKAPRRSKHATLESQRLKLGKVRIKDLVRASASSSSARIVRRKALVR